MNAWQKVILIALSQIYSEMTWDGSIATIKSNANPNFVIKVPLSEGAFGGLWDLDFLKLSTNVQFDGKAHYVISRDGLEWVEENIGRTV